MILVWQRAWRGPWNGQKGQDVRPFGFVLSENAKKIRKGRPGPEAPFHGARVMFSQAAVGATRGRLAGAANDASPILQKGTVCQANIEGVRFEAGGANRRAPAGEESGDVILRDSGAGDEFGARGWMARSTGDSDKSAKKIGLVRRGRQRGSQLITIIDSKMVTFRDSFVNENSGRRAKAGVRNGRFEQPDKRWGFRIPERRGKSARATAC